MLVRLVPLRGDTPVRFEFTNMWLEAGKPGKLKYRGTFRAASRAQLEVADGHVMLNPTKGEVTLNGQLLIGPRPLAHGDVVALRSQKEPYLDPESHKWSKGAEVAFEFEEDLNLAKQARWQRETASGVQHCRPGTVPDGTAPVSRHRHAPDHRPANLTGWVAVDETGITLPKGKDRRKERLIRWEDLDAIKFEPERRTTDYGGDALRAAATGFQQGIELGGYHVADATESGSDLKLHAASYTVRFQCHDKDLDHTAGPRDRCELLAQAIEYFAPFDLPWLGNDVVDKRQLRPAT